ncbi:MAG: 50S ribosomal protein L9 [Candidatus Borkfalkia sp.]
MKVILKQDVKGTGKKGAILEVSDGYAKNFLLKKGLAEQASSVAVNSLKLQKEAEERKRAEEIREIKELAAKIDKTEVTLSIKCGENGKVFGSVTSKEIASNWKIWDLPSIKEDPVKGRDQKRGHISRRVRMMEGVIAKIAVK